MAKYDEVVRSHLENMHKAFKKPQNKEQLSCIQPRGPQKIKSKPNSHCFCFAYHFYSYKPINPYFGQQYFLSLPLEIILHWTNKFLS